MDTDTAPPPPISPPPPFVPCQSGEMGDRKRHHNWNNHVKQKSVEPGVSGIFFTCEGHEKQALREAYDLIDELLEKDGPSKTDVDGDDDDDGVDPDEDIADAIKRQCTEQREAAKAKKKRCIQRPTGVKNSLFVSVRDANILELCDTLITVTQNAPRCRYLQRALPVEETVAVGLKEMNDVILKLVQRHLVPSQPSGVLPTYALEFKARNNDAIKKTDVLRMLNEAVSMVAPVAKVDLNDPELTFFIQVVRKTIMAGVAKRFQSRRKYSMRPKKEEEEAIVKKVEERKEDQVTVEKTTVEEKEE